MTPTQQTQYWVEKVVIGLTLCPFAKREFDTGRIRYYQSIVTDTETALHEFLDECHYLDDTPDTATTLILYSEGFNDFNLFLDFLDTANRLLRAENYEGIYQVASFHPDYVFQNTAPTDPANATNRSPFPTLHIIRESDIEIALASFPQPEKIPVRNQALCRKLGLNTIRKLYQPS